MTTIAGVSTLPSADSVVIESFILILRGLWITRITCVAAMTLMMYDAFTTIDLEVRLVWRSRWSFVKIMFILNRYMTPAWLSWVLYATHIYKPSDEVCAIVNTSTIIGAILIVGVHSAVYLNRVYAIYERTKQALFLSAGLYALPTLTSAIALAIKTIHSRPQPQLFQEYSLPFPSELDGLLRGCQALALPHNAYLMFIAMLLTDAIPFAVIAWKHFSEDDHEDVFQFLYYEETIYLIITTPVLISGLVFSLKGEVGHAILRSGYVLACKSMVTSRMLLRLKLFLLQGSANEPGADPHTGTMEIKFATLRPKVRLTVVISQESCQDPDFGSGSQMDGTEMGVLAPQRDPQETNDWDKHTTATAADAGGMGAADMLCSDLAKPRPSTSTSASVETLSGLCESEDSRAKG